MLHFGINILCRWMWGFQPGPLNVVLSACLPSGYWQHSSMTVFGRMHDTCQVALIDMFILENEFFYSRESDWVEYLII